MNKKLFYTLILLFACNFLVVARDVYDCKAQSTGIIIFLADSIDFRSDLTRVYGRMSGRPHTSGRIDFMSAVSGGKEMMATDIDGVDFKRYFQWEDDGIIPIEIDFPPMKPNGSITIKTNGPTGESIWKISLGKLRKKRRK